MSIDNTSNSIRHTTSDTDRVKRTGSQSIFKEFEHLVNTLYATYAKLENIRVDEAKQKMTAHDLQAYFSQKFSILEQAIPWSKNRATQGAFIGSSMMLLNNRCILQP